MVYQFVYNVIYLRYVSKSYEEPLRISINSSLTKQLLNWTLLKQGQFNSYIPFYRGKYFKLHYSTTLVFASPFSILCAKSCTMKADQMNSSLYYNIHVLSVLHFVIIGIIYCRRQNKISEMSLGILVLNN